MKWNPTDGYVQYSEATYSIKKRLGLGILDHEVRPELAPYVTQTYKYLVENLVELGEDADMLEKLKKIFDIFSMGSDLIVANRALDLGKLINLSVTDEPGDEVLYNQERFIFSWSNVMSCLVTRLKIIYANLLEDPVLQGCPCLCGRGETFKDWEKYTSGVYQDDEEYSNYKYNTTSTWRPNSKYPECGCGYRIK